MLPAAISEADARTRGLDRGLSPALKMTATGREEARVRASRAGRALVIGGSMGGLFTGLLMRRQGWDVRIFERVGGELAGRGAGIVTHPVLHDALRRAGVEDLDDLGVPLAARRFFSLDGRLVGEHPRPQIATAWDRLFRLLRARFPDAHYRTGHALAAVEDAPGGAGVVARFADGSTAEGDLLVAADGFRSTVRSLLLPQAVPRYAGYVGWRGLLAEAEMPPALHAEMFDHFTFCLPEGEQMLGYPVAGPGNDLRPGHRRYNFVWYRPAPEATVLARLLTDATGRRHELAIPPPLIAPAVLAELRADAERMLAPQFAALVRLSPQPFLQPIYDLSSPRLALGRVALLGDAAFVARPHVGAGLSEAALDAMALADAVGASGGEVAAGLAAYEAARLPQGERIVKRAQELGTCIAADGMGEDERRMALRSRDPGVVLAETAVLDFLDG
ncbi:MAG: FAD binding domain-containing protein [Roseomonas sp.]|nr:FAD binding domain-containing protein [Roseomonas sp.]